MVSHLYNPSLFHCRAVLGVSISEDESRFFTVSQGMASLYEQNLVLIFQWIQNHLSLILSELSYTSYNHYCLFFPKKLLTFETMINYLFPSRSLHKSFFSYHCRYPTKNEQHGGWLSNTSNEPVKYGKVSIACFNVDGIGWRN